MVSIDTDKLVNWLLSTPLRNAIFDEVNWQNSIGHTLADSESMRAGSLFWYEPDGWRGWTQKEDMSYYFHDIPEKDIGDMFDIFYGLDKE